MLIWPDASSFQNNIAAVGLDGRTALKTRIGLLRLAPRPADMKPRPADVFDAGTVRWRVTFVSQSVTVCTAILDWARDRDIGFSHFVSLGETADFARTHPFAYAAEDRPGLTRVIAPLSPSPELARWAARFLRADGSADTRELLVDMTQTIRRTFNHVARHEKGTQDPIRTLKLGSGSCRDLAVLMIAALRSLGIAARFVSGYVHLADDDDDDEGVTSGNSHAWVQVCVPGPGWVDFDPSSGMIGNQNLVRIAVVHEPREAIPLQLSGRRPMPVIPRTRECSTVCGRSLAEAGGQT